MENSLLLIFGEIWPNFGVTLKNRKKLNLDHTYTVVHSISSTVLSLLTLVTCP